MSFVFDDALALMKAPHSRWPFVTKPYYVHTDFPWLNGTPVWAQNVDFVCDYDVQCIYPAPVVVYHDQGGGYYYDDEDPGPSVGWNNVGTLPFDFRTNEPHDFSEFHIKQDAASADGEFFGADAQVSCQGVTYLWSALDQNVADSADPSSTKFTTFRIGVGWGADLVIYSVRYIGQGDIKVAKSYDGGVSWLELESLRQRGEFSAAWGIPDEDAPTEPPAEGEDPPPGGDAPRAMNYLEFRLIAGRLLIWAGNNATPYVFEENRVNADGGSIITINYLGIRAYKFLAFAASAHPTKWRTVSVYDSPEIPTGFYSEAIADPYIDPAGIVPAGWNAYVSSDPSFTYLYGPSVYFRLFMEGPVDGTFRGQDYSDYVAAVRAVNLFWRPQIDYTPATPIVTLPEKVTVTHSFNPNTLQVSSSASVIYNNNRPRNLPTGQFGTWGEWLRAYGHVAMDFAMNRTTPSGFYGPPQQVASLYGNTVGEVIATPEGSIYKMTCADRSIQLMNPRFALPWLDGWNVYYAMAYLAQLGGVDIGDMDFAPYVPSVPFGPGSDLGSPEGPAYYLPVGDAGSVITRFSGVPLWEVMSKIAYFIGYMLFFDVYGRLQFRKFKMPAGVKRSFFESDRASSTQPGGGLEGCWDMRVRKDMGEVRNTSIVIGVNAFGPRYDPIVYKFVDGDSIFNPNVFNHKGFEDAAVWMDSQFADDYFAWISAQAMYYFLRNPGYEVDLTTWLQPDIFPLDMILVQSPKLGTYNLRFMVTDVAHTVEKSGGSSQIRARFIPE